MPYVFLRLLSKSQSILHNSQKHKLSTLNIRNVNKYIRKHGFTCVILLCNDTLTDMKLNKVLFVWQNQEGITDRPALLELDRFVSFPSVSFSKKHPTSEILTHPAVHILCFCATVNRIKTEHSFCFPSQSVTM